MGKPLFTSALSPATVFFCMVLGHCNLTACVWDADTLGQEQRAHPKMADAILSPPANPPDTAPLQKRIHLLLQHRQDADPAWWNDLAGAYLRLGQAQEAVNLLEPVLKKFDANYGVHANLGTAYHLLHRYKEAEREIARDLEINPDAHFGLEKYHLALLQYLSRDTNYQRFHVYVDEFTASFLQGGIMAHSSPLSYESTTNHDSNAVARAALADQLAQVDGTQRDVAYHRRRLQQGIATLDAPLGYSEHWNLATDPKLEEGVIYMASLNPHEPACFVMLGVKSLHVRDLNLAIKAYERAIQLGSPQSDLLHERIDRLRDHIHKARMEKLPLYLAIGAIIGAIAIYAALKVCSRCRHRRAPLIPA